ncbi:ClpXP protease specificity-enhancing factor [Endozoicomonas sp. SCSIO W0465]|uniref:ClpXP protease specificity-enhancing factor n=1 Tax=Endozoicomonas sp. SCSIO W0465 TaxID=2918516 RepID=UPI00207540BD|nr:ClpXP protease specificity-enhancing factor [Endozoicomonas sp. SCSIO W0465]USE39795.1 ClpXP protease specificity-enhancing factor [Endozoicomonas sp. SCSIO W0465]
MTSSRSYIARALYEWILDNDCTPYILVDAHRRGVEVPQAYVKDGQIVLNISPTAVRALNIGNDYIMFDGRFGGRALTITVPVPALMAIYAQENGQGMVFEVEPLDGQEEVEDTQAEVPDEEPPQPPKKPGRPHLKVVK